MTDTIYNHISLRVPGHHDRFYINAFGLMYDEISASNLVTVDVDGKIIDDPTGLGINPAGFIIHGAIHRARPDVACVLPRSEEHTSELQSLMRISFAVFF